MALNESQKREWAQILASDIWQAVKEEVLNMTDGSVEGMPMDQAAIKMANEKGVRNAFRLLKKAALPDPPPTLPLPRKTLH